MYRTLNKIFDQYDAEKEKIEISMEQMRKDIAGYTDKIVLYGAGSAGIAFLYYLRKAGICPIGFSDGNKEKWGEVCEGIPIVSPEEIITLAGSRVLVIVTINTDGKKYCKSFAEELRKGGHTGVHQMLHDCGCKNVIDYTYFRRCHKLFQGDEYNLPSCSDVYLMRKNKENMEDVFSYLEDDLSKETFSKIVEFRMLDDRIEIPTLSQENQYFEYDIYKRTEQEVFLDCGAFNGITLKKFLRNNYGFSYYYAFEPDRKNAELLRIYLESLEPGTKNKIELCPFLLYNKQDSLKLYELGGPGSFVSGLGKEAVSADTIDKVLKEKKATFIKMNIEGMETAVLQGAEDTIKKYKPVLAIAGYHKTWDLWEIPQLIKDYYKDYKIYLRSYMNHISFVYYAVSKERCVI